MRALFALFFFVAIASAATVSVTVDLTDPTKWNCGEESYDYGSQQDDTFPIGSISVPPSTLAGSVKMDALFDNSAYSEYLQLVCEGIDFGAFNDPSHLYGGSWTMTVYAYNNDCSQESGFAPISASDMTALTLDGKIDCDLTTSTDVSFCCKYDSYPNMQDQAAITFSIDSGSGPVDYSITVDLTDPAKWNCGADYYYYPPSADSRRPDTYPIPVINIPHTSAPGSVELTALYDNSAPTEFISLNCEGLDFGPLNQPYNYDPASIWDIQQYAYNSDCEVEIGVAQLSGTQMDSLTADGQVQCSITTSKEVDYCCSSYYPVQDGATVTFTYNTAPVTTFTVNSNSIEPGQSVSGTIRATDDDGITAWYYNCDQGGAGSNVQTTVSVPANTLATFTFNCLYPVDGTYCLAVCVGDSTDDCPTLLASGNACSSKRNGFLTGQLIVVSAANAGDPYFQGFDGTVFKFDGLIGHVYNYISSPTLQLNGLIEKGIAEDRIHTMKSFTRQIGVVWDKHQQLLFKCDYMGRTVLEVWFPEENQWKSWEAANSNETLRFDLGLSHLLWEPNLNITRHPLHLQPHQVSSKLTLMTAEYILEVYSVDLTLKNSQLSQRYHFLDQSFTRRRPAAAQQAACLEGVWGRTTCVSGNTAFDMEVYDLNGDLLSVDFARNLFGTAQ